MKIIELNQGSQEWLDMRKTKITGTDAGIIMRVNPFKSPLELFNQKMGIDEEDKINDKMREGMRLEPIVRKKVEMHLDLEFTPMVALHHEHAWMMASLDGINLNKKCMIEIKCPSKKTSHRAARRGDIHKYYYAQIQHCLAVTELNYCLFCSFYAKDKETPLILHNIYRDQAYINDMIEKEKIFYFDHLMELEPPSEEFYIES